MKKKAKVSTKVTSYLFRNEFDEVLKDTGQPKPALLIFHVIKKLLSVWNEDADSQRFLNLCR